MSAKKPVEARAEPNYDLPCESCGQVPTVRVVAEGLRPHETRLCGPCCWGEADTIDPENW